jgi:hypothetical protein
MFAIEFQAMFFQLMRVRAARLTLMLSSAASAKVSRECEIKILIVFSL